MEPADGLFILRQPEHFEPNEKERKISDALADGPHTYIEIGRRIGSDPNLLSVESLISGGYLGMVGLTPTDLLHVTGEYIAWDREGAGLAVAAVAKKSVCANRISSPLPKIG